MKKVKIEDAVGMVLAHDLTKIVPGEYKGAPFKKGHIIQTGDLEELKNMGKNHIFVVSLTDDEVHENDAAGRIGRAVAGNGLTVVEPREGKANIRAAERGVLQVNQQTLLEINSLGNLDLVTLHRHTVVTPGQIVAAAKIIPLTIGRETVEKAEAICREQGPLIRIQPMFPLKTGIIITGSEVYEGRIQDRFGAVFKEKISLYGGEILDLQYAPDDGEFIQGLIRQMIGRGAEVLLISGGMAVDADDVTPQAIAASATEVVTYGMPLLPGAMGMIAYCGDIPLIGVPACGMYHKTTVFDLIFPRVLARERLKREDLYSLAHGGLCQQCESCHYPNCTFGKG
jgi:hypothetical protein